MDFNAVNDVVGFIAAILTIVSFCYTIIDAIWHRKK